MKKLLILSVAIIAFYIPGIAQANLQPSPELKAAMAKLELLAGNWKGEGSIQMGPTKHKFHQTETISFKANNTVLQIEGLGLDEEGRAAHQAFAIISYDTDKSLYNMLAVRADGKVIYPIIKFTDDGVLEWGFDTGSGQVKFVITLKDNTWHETGSFSADGTNWMPFLEMNLTK